MDTPSLALGIAILGLISTCTFAILNFRYTKRTNDRAVQAENRSASSEARASERSRVVWQAMLSDSGYIVLVNDSPDFANNVRIEYSILLPANPDSEPVPPSFLRSHDPQGAGKFTGSFRNAATKDSIGPDEAVGLPVVPNCPFSLNGGARRGWRFGLSLYIEWFTQNGSPKSEHLYAEDLGVVYSAFKFPDLDAVTWGSDKTTMEAVTPIRTPEDDRREYEAAMRDERAASPGSP
jgi:hypothetical protein